MRRRIAMAVALLVLVGIGAALFLTTRSARPDLSTPAPAPVASAPALEPAPVVAPTVPARPDHPEEKLSVDSDVRVLEAIRAREAAYAAKTAEERRSKQRLCPAFTLPDFPWPDAPQPTTSAQIARAYLSAPGESDPATLGEVRKRLARLAQQAGYRVPSILGAGCQGFAMVLDLERLRDDGRRVPGVDGFAGPGQRKVFSVWDILLDLIKAEPGYFRIIVVVVTDEARTASAARATADQLRTLSDAGKAALPAPLDTKAFDENYVVEALVYEFEKFPKQEVAELRKPEGRLAATTHLAQAGLIALARPAR